MMKKLIEGVSKFTKNLDEEQSSFFKQLAKGQEPEAIMITCSDSRIHPHLLTSTNPGEIFLLRNVGNIVPSYAHADKDSSVLAAVEFAVSSLNISDIIICGHSECGAMKAISSGTESLPCCHLKSWLDMGQESMVKMEKSQFIDPSLPDHDRLSQANVLQQIENLASHPFVRKHLDNNEISIHGWWFDIGSAAIHTYENNKFQPI